MGGWWEKSLARPLLQTPSPGYGFSQAPSLWPTHPEVPLPPPCYLWLEGNKVWTGSYQVLVLSKEKHTKQRVLSEAPEINVLQGIIRPEQNCSGDMCYPRSFLLWVQEEEGRKLAARGRVWVICFVLFWLIVLGHVSHWKLTAYVLSHVPMIICVLNHVQA